MIYKSLMSHDNGYTHTHSAYITADNEEEAEEKASLIAEKLHLVCQEPVFLAEKQELHCPFEVYQEPILIYATDNIENKTAMNIRANGDSIQSARKKGYRR